LARSKASFLPSATLDCAKAAVAPAATPIASAHPSAGSSRSLSENLPVKAPFPAMIDGRVYSRSKHKGYWLTILVRWAKSIVY
jgi:hypothetical protein